MLAETDSLMNGGLQSMLEQFSSFTMAAEEAAAEAVAVAVKTDFSASQASEYSNYSLYGTLALVRHHETLLLSFIFELLHLSLLYNSCLSFSIT